MAENLYEIQGFQELVAKVKLLSKDKDKRKPIIAILRKSAQSTIKIARQLAPKSDRPMPVKSRAKKKRQMPGTGAKSIKAEVMLRSKVPMIIVGPRSKGKYDGWYLRQFVIPGYNIYTKGFKRKHRKGANNHAAKGKVDPNLFMKKAHDASQRMVIGTAIPQMEKFIQKQINKL